MSTFIGSSYYNLKRKNVQHIFYMKRMLLKIFRWQESELEFEPKKELEAEKKGNELERLQGDGDHHHGCGRDNSSPLPCTFPS